MTAAETPNAESRTSHRFEIVPVTIRQAKAFVWEHHRHAEPQFGWKFGAGLEIDGELAGVAMAGQPVNKHLDDGRTVEVTRLCTVGHKNAVSALYGAICRAARALGYLRVVTYTLESESGVSPAAAGFVLDGISKGNGSWNRPSRPRMDEDLFGSRRPPPGDKRRWMRDL